ncbi:MAG: ROK family protein [Clostridia bacterium]|nr:ROK family protein [Clostridia bacterium]
MLDKNYYPMYLYQKDFLTDAKEKGAKRFILALERGEGECERYETYLYESGHDDENLRYAKKLVKAMIWAYGGYKFYLYGGESVVEGLRQAYSDGGERAFDYNFMQNVYLRPLEFVCVGLEDLPEAACKAEPSSAKAGGYRIGFDAGGSDRKVTACIDGKVVYEKETIWFPKLNSDPTYHLEGIVDSIDNALNALGGRVDALGVSTAGIVVDNEVRISSLFRKVSQKEQNEFVRPIYKNLAKKYNCPVKVANDGDVAALAGAFTEGGEILGIAMGTSLAAGYVDSDMRIRGCLNELAFVPVDANDNAAVDEWSGDVGVGVMYHSQDGVIKLAPEAGIALDETLSPAEKLKVVQALANDGDERAVALYERMGDYFGYTLLWFACLYNIKKAIFLGRVASGKGGEILLDRARSIIAAEGSSLEIVLPDEMSRRLGQSFTAAGL